MPRLSRSEWIAEHDRYAQLRHAQFRRAAEFVAAALSALPQVQAVSLFGSVARPPVTIVTPRRHWELLHDPKDVDLAVWVERADGLDGLRRTVARALASLFAAEGIGVALHQVDLFLFATGSNAYLGRLCDYAICPKGKPECGVPGCGREPFLKQHQGFVFDPAALVADRTVRLHPAEPPPTP